MLRFWPALLQLAQLPLVHALRSLSLICSGKALDGMLGKSVKLSAKVYFPVDGFIFIFEMYFATLCIPRKL
jgi:hypothetical protein